jgi:hypothetical protein
MDSFPQRQMKTSERLEQETAYGPHNAVTIYIIAVFHDLEQMVIDRRNRSWSTIQRFPGKAG